MQGVSRGLPRGEIGLRLTLDEQLYVLAKLGQNPGAVYMKRRRYGCEVLRLQDVLHPTRTILAVRGCVTDRKTRCCGAGTPFISRERGSSVLLTCTTRCLERTLTQEAFCARVRDSSRCRVRLDIQPQTTTRQACALNASRRARALSRRATEDTGRSPRRHVSQRWDGGGVVQMPVLYKHGSYQELEHRLTEMRDTHPVERWHVLERYVRGASHRRMVVPSRKTRQGRVPELPPRSELRIQGEVLEKGLMVVYCYVWSEQVEPHLVDRGMDILADKMYRGDTTRLTLPKPFLDRLVFA